MRFLKSTLLAVAAILAAIPAYAASISLLTGPLEPSQMLPTLNGLINSINASDPYVGVFKSSIYPPASSAQFFGAGTTTVPFPLGTSADQTAGRIYAEGLNTTGYARALDTRMYFTGVGGEGEAVRAYGLINNVTVATGGTVNGIHASLATNGTSSAVSGAGHAIRGTLELGTGTTIGGTIDVLQLDTFAEGTVPATAAFMSLANLGTNKLNYLARLTSPSTTMFATAGSGATSCGVSTGAVASKVLKVVVDGTDYWLPLCSTNS